MARDARRKKKVEAKVIDTTDYEFEGTEETKQAAWLVQESLWATGAVDRSDVVNMDEVLAQVQ